MRAEVWGTARANMRWLRSDAPAWWRAECVGWAFDARSRNSCFPLGIAVCESLGSHLALCRLRRGKHASLAIGVRCSCSHGGSFLVACRGASPLLAGVLPSLLGCTLELRDACERMRAERERPASTPHGAARASAASATIATCATRRPTGGAAFLEKLDLEASNLQWKTLRPPMHWWSPE